MLNEFNLKSKINNFLSLMNTDEAIDDAKVDECMDFAPLLYSLLY